MLRWGHTTSLTECNDIGIGGKKVHGDVLLESGRRE